MARFSILFSLSKERRASTSVDTRPGTILRISAPNLLKELQEKVSPVVRKLIPPSQTFPRPAPMSEAEFRWEHNQDAMAVEKLSEGIRLFAVDQRKLEDLLAAKL